MEQGEGADVQAQDLGARYSLLGLRNVTTKYYIPDDETCRYDGEKCKYVEKGRGGCGGCGVIERIAQGFKKGPVIN